jgi:hypothetical protein
MTHSLSPSLRACSPDTYVATVYAGVMSRVITSTKICKHNSKKKIKLIKPLIQCNEHAQLKYLYLRF